MKHLIIALLIVLMTAVGSFADHHGEDSQPYTAIVPSMVVIAEWVQGYAENFKERDIYYAVEEVMKEGVQPLDIMSYSLDIDGMNPMMVVSALYCAGASPEDIRQAVEYIGVSEMILVAGFEQSKTVCGAEITDTQAYTTIGPNFSSVPDGGGSGSSYGSPSTF